MMKIDFIAPARTIREQAKVDTLTASMQALVAKLMSWGQQPGNATVLLTPKQRATLLKDGFPELLVKNTAFYTADVRVEEEGGFEDGKQLMVGFTSKAFTDAYKSEAIRASLFRSHKGRCAYCESLIQHVDYGDVEHFRPKAGYETQWSTTLFRPAYYDLAYAPSNLYLSCALCNQQYKGNLFPVIGPRAPEVPIAREVPALVNPYVEDPREVLRFNPLNGQAYPFDLVRAFYASPAGKGWGAPQIEQELWKDPGLIPNQSDADGVRLSNPGVNEAYGQWVGTVKDATLSRGWRTITDLGLNRQPLVRSRLVQLRQLRGLFWARTGNGVDASSARTLLDTLLMDPAGAVILAPQYVSLTVDALHTWLQQALPNLDWIGRYSTQIAHLESDGTIIERQPSSDALCYMVLDVDPPIGGRRRLVHISADDLVYGNSSEIRGIALPIDWSKEIDNAVEIKNSFNTVVTTTTLRELITSWNWSVFETHQLWVLGDFRPYRG